MSKIQDATLVGFVSSLFTSFASFLQLNGSLRKWEKTHTMKIYSDELNGRRTSVSFAYYPQFWLPKNKRPIFVKALYQLIARYLEVQILQT